MARKLETDDNLETLYANRALLKDYCLKEIEVLEDLQYNNNEQEPTLVVLRALLGLCRSWDE